MIDEQNEVVLEDYYFYMDWLPGKPIIKIPRGFAFNAAGVMLMSSINKHLNTRMGIFQRLRLGGSIQCFGAVVVISAGLMANAPLWLLMSGLFLVGSGIALSMITVIGITQ
jgi:hypothetical protein